MQLAKFWTIVSNSTLEVILLVGYWAVVALARGRLDVNGATFTLSDLALLATLSTIIRRAYTAHLEAMYYRYPGMRTQPPKKTVGHELRDVTGRTVAELTSIDFHDRLTMLSKLFACDLLFYFTIGRALYPEVKSPDCSAPFCPLYWFARLVGHQYLLSFGMYWAHRNLHVNPFLWKHIHSLHHYAKTPLARATYEDHWFDNYLNALISEVATPILAPLPRNILFVSRIFRVCESLEKHSGLSGPVNVAHFLQAWLPFAQQPAHHDWHHEGSKGSNYTFTSIGGFWDVAFGTRHPARANQALQLRARTTRLAFLDRPAICALPVVAMAAAAVLKVAAGHSAPDTL